MKIYMNEVADHEKKAIQLRLLCDFDKFCKKHDIQYFLYYGTLIGAIRHGGMIPWDDDIDVAMTRIEYKKFIKLVKLSKNELCVSFPSFQNSTAYVMTKIYEKMTIIFEDFDGEDRLNRIGINIDLFVVDSKVNWLKTKVIGLLLLILNVKIVHPKESALKITKYMLLVAKLVFRIIPAGLVVYFVDLISSSSRSTRMGCNYSIYRHKEDFNRCFFEKFVDVDFEGISLPIPADYDLILKKIYGDYMLPPVDKTSQHTVRSFTI